MVSYGCHHSTWEAVAKESEVQDPLCLHTEFKANLSYMKLSPNLKNKRTKILA